MKDKTETQTTEKTEPKARALKTPETSVHFKNKTFNEVAYYLAERFYYAAKGQLLPSEPDKVFEALQILEANNLKHLVDSQLEGIREDAAQREIEEKSGAFALKNPTPETQSGKEKLQQEITKACCKCGHFIAWHKNSSGFCRYCDCEKPELENPAPDICPQCNVKFEPSKLIFMLEGRREKFCSFQCRNEYFKNKFPDFAGAVENPAPGDQTEQIKAEARKFLNRNMILNRYDLKLVELAILTDNITAFVLAQQRAGNAQFLPMPIDTTALKILDHFRSERDKWREHLEKLELQARNSHPITDLNHLEARIKLAETQHERFARDFEIIEEIINQSEGKADA